MSSTASEGGSRLAEIRALNRHLVSAQDAKILKVVAMVDALPQRGAADALIAPLRPRLMQLRPSRPQSALRLLFVPFDPVLVPGPQWRRDALSIPRTAIPSLALQVEALAPGLLAETDRAVAGTTTVDAEAVRRAGPPLWTAAAAALAGAPVPGDWSAATGLTAADHTAIRDAVVLVLRHAPDLLDQLDATVPNADMITAVLTDAARHPAVMGVLVSVILSWLPHAAAQVLAFTSAHSSPGGLPGRTATERAVERVLEGIEAEHDASPTVASMPRLRRAVALLDQLEAGTTDRPTRSARIAATRAKLDHACRAQFQTLLQETVVDRLAAGLPADAKGLTELETAARDVRRFEHVARRINRSDHYDRQIRATIDGLAPRGTDAVQARVDRLRLAEILLGPEKALQMLMESEK